jgi:cell division septum initiation protein DivIVA
LEGGVPLTPESIADPNLPRVKVGGYSVTVTDEFLSEIAWEWRGIQSDRRKLIERNAELERQLQEIHRRLEELRGNPVVTHEREPRSGAALAAAYRAAEAIRNDARLESEALLKKARKRALVLEHEVERAREASAERIRELEEVQRQVRRGLSSFLTEMLDAIETPDSAGAPDVVQELRKRVVSVETVSAEPNR